MASDNSESDGNSWQTLSEAEMSLSSRETVRRRHRSRSRDASDSDSSYRATARHSYRRKRTPARHDRNRNNGQDDSYYGSSVSQQRDGVGHRSHHLNSFGAKLI